MTATAPPAPSPVASPAEPVAPSATMAAGLGRVPVLAAATFATATQSFVFAGLLNEMAADLRVPVAQAGQLATAFALAFAVSAPLVAAATAHLPRRAVMVGALVTLAALNALIVLAPSFPALLALRVLCGIAAGTIVPAASATAAALAPPDKRGRALALVIGGTTAAFLLGIPMGSVVGDHFGWRACFAFSGTLALFAALAIRLLLPEVRGERGGLGGLRLALRRPGVPGGLALTFLGFAAVFCFAAYIGPAVNRVSGLTGSGVGIMQALVGAASLAGVPLGAWLADRRGVGVAWWFPVAIALASAGQAVLLAGAADGTGVLAAVLQGALIVTTSASLFALSPVVQARLVSLVPEARAVVLAANASALFFGQAAGAAVGGAAIWAAGLPGISVAGGLLALVATAAAWRLRAAPPTP